MENGIIAIAPKTTPYPRLWVFSQPDSEKLTYLITIRKKMQKLGDAGDQEKVASEN